jgi:hypothetical protein
VNPWLQTGLSLVVGLMTAGGALLGVRLAVRGNNRAEWWRRFTWAADLTLDDSPVKPIGPNSLRMIEETLRLLTPGLLRFPRRALDAPQDEQPDRDRATSPRRRRG